MFRILFYYKQHALLNERLKAEKWIIKAILKLKKTTSEQTNRQTNKQTKAKPKWNGQGELREMQQGTAFDYLSKDIIENETFFLLRSSAIRVYHGFFVFCIYFNYACFLSTNFCLKTTFERHTDGWCIVCCCCCSSSSIVGLYATNIKHLMIKCNSHCSHSRTFPSRSFVRACSALPLTPFPFQIIFFLVISQSFCLSATRIFC